MFVDIVDKICAEEGFSFKVAKIYAEIDKELIKSKLEDITPCGPVPEITLDEVENAPHIVAQMGAEPFIAALEGGADIILAGESSGSSRRHSVRLSYIS